MFSPQAEEALAVLLQALTQQPELEEHVYERWRSHGLGAATQQALSPELAKAADTLSASLLALAQPGHDPSALSKPFGEPAAPVLLLWCYASTWHREITLAPILALAAKRAEL